MHERDCIAIAIPASDAMFLIQNMCVPTIRNPKVGKDKAIPRQNLVPLSRVAFWGDELCNVCVYVMEHQG